MSEASCHPFPIGAVSSRPRIPWSLLEFPDGFPDPAEKFPVWLRREFGFSKLGNAGQDCISEDRYRADLAHFLNFPCYFPCCREFSEDELVLKILAQPIGKVRVPDRRQVIRPGPAATRRPTRTVRT